YGETVPRPRNRRIAIRNMHPSPSARAARADGRPSDEDEPDGDKASSGLMPPPSQPGPCSTSTGMLAVSGFGTSRMGLPSVPTCGRGARTSARLGKAVDGLPRSGGRHALQGYGIVAGQFALLPDMVRSDHRIIARQPPFL